MKTKPLATILKPSEEPCYESDDRPTYLVRFADETQLNLSIKGIGIALEKRDRDEITDDR
jgi:hypothetical protein